MKQCLFLLIAAALVFASCQKNGDSPMNTPADSSANNRVLVYHLSNTSLTITPVPEEQCYTNTDSSGRPCDIFVAFDCRLTRPVSSTIHVEVVRTITTDVGIPVTEQDTVGFSIAPNTVTTSFRTTLRNPDKQNVVGVFRIRQVYLDQSTD